MTVSELGAVAEIVPRTGVRCCHRYQPVNDEPLHAINENAVFGASTIDVTLTLEG